MMTHLCMKPRVCIESMASTDSAIYICATSSLKVSFFINIVIKSPSIATKEINCFEQCFEYFKSLTSLLECAN